jgi:hypothetical protein
MHPLYYLELKIEIARFLSIFLKIKFADLKNQKPTSFHNFFFYIIWPGEKKKKCWLVLVLGEDCLLGQHVKPTMALHPRPWNPQGVMSSVHKVHNALPPGH